MGIFRDYFNRLVINDTQRDILRSCFEGYKNTSSLIKAQDFQYGPQKNLYSYARIASIDNCLLALNNKYDGLMANSVLNNAHNYYYTLITIKNVKMTVSAVNFPGSQPRESLFRNELASCQVKFDVYDGKFELCDLKNISESSVYAMIIHSPALDNPKQPTSVQIVFPNETCTGYLDRIDLFKKYPELVEALTREEMERIPDKAEVKLSVQQQEKLL